MSELPQPLLGLSLLLVDDAPENQLVFSKLLTLAGANVILADNGVRATEWLAALAFDLVLMDLQMPHMDGFEAVSIARARGYLGPILALSAATTDKVLEMCLARGFDAYLHKHVPAETLVELIQIHCRKSNLVAAVHRVPSHGNLVGAANTCD